MFFPLMAAISVAPALVRSARQFVIVNECPTTSTLYINGESQGTIAASGGTLMKTVENDFSGFLYLTANGGNADGSGTTRAGFFGQDNYYYIVKDPNHFNTGVSIAPINRQPSDGFCVPDKCSTVSCSNAFSQPPTAFPPPSSKSPMMPLYSCPPANGAFMITFCPGGFFPPPTPVAIHPNGHGDKCLDVQASDFVEGTIVQLWHCNGSRAQKWIVNRGDTQVRVAGTNLCLDAGSHPGDGVGMKIWKCINNLPAQSWYYTDDNRIALKKKGQCLDLRNGGLVFGNKVQTWKCTTENTNQIWTL